MKIKLLTSLAGPNFAYSPGDVVDWDDAESLRLIAAEFAVPVRTLPIETADAAPAPEAAVTRKGKARP